MNNAEEREATENVVNVGVYSGEGYDGFYGVCPSCGQIVYLRDEMNYCGKCGKHIVWDIPDTVSEQLMELREKRMKDD